MNSYEEFKMFYYSNIILLIGVLFVIIYIIINWEDVSNGNYLSGEIVKPILISGIIFLILHMFLTWDDDKINSNGNELVLPKYRLDNNLNHAQNEIIDGNIPVPKINIENMNNKYKVLNRFDVPTTHLNPNTNNHNPTLEQFSKIGQNLSNSENNLNKLSNQNIFVSHKNSSKYGIKFI